MAVTDLGAARTSATIAPALGAGARPDFVELLGMPVTSPENEVLAAVVAVAMKATASPIGFCHYLNPDGRTLEIGACAAGPSDAVASAADRRVLIPPTGWGAPIGLGGPFVDDQPHWAADLPGFAKELGPVHRYLGAPVVDRDGGLLLGLANAPSRYTARDSRTATQIARAGWAVLVRGRTYRAALDELTLLNDLADLRTGTWRWDPETGQVAWGDAARRLLDVGERPEPTWAPLDDRLEPFSRYGLQQARGTLPLGQPLELELWTSARDGQQLKLHLRGRWSPRPQGTGWVVQGTLADVTAADHAQRAHDRATRDQLTGLTNRAGVIAELTRRIAAGHRRAGDQFAVHMLDLDRFKQVNDAHGHLAGDAVLRATAARLRQTVRRNDLAARLGGDEFVIIQDRCVTHPEARALANRVIAALNQPIDVNGIRHTVGASIGVAFSDADRPSVKDLLTRADDALYAAKRSGSGLHMDLPHPCAGPAAPASALPPADSPDRSSPRRRRGDAPLVPALVSSKRPA